MFFPARSNLLHNQGIASSDTERPPCNDTPFLVKALLPRTQVTRLQAQTVVYSFYQF